jgi:hypothetical protein
MAELHGSCRKQRQAAMQLQLGALLHTFICSQWNTSPPRSLIALLSAISCTRPAMLLREGGRAVSLLWPTSSTSSCCSDPMSSADRTQWQERFASQRGRHAKDPGGMGERRVQRGCICSMQLQTAVVAAPTALAHAARTATAGLSHAASMCTWQDGDLVPAQL